MTLDQRLQVMRSIDKFDKIGRDGVVELLQKPDDEFGANLDPVRAELVGMFLDTKGETNEEAFVNLSKFFMQSSRVRTRLDLMCVLDEAVEPDGRTKWDRLLSMPTTEDQTWRDGCRPANIAWALDDMVNSLIASRRSRNKRRS